MRQSLLFISLRSWRSHKLRVGITVLSVCIAVSAFVALQGVNQSLEHSLEATVDKLAGKATLQITAGEAGIPEEVVDTVRSTPGVSAATGVLQVFCRISEEFRDWRGMLIFGVDPGSFQKLRPAGGDSLLLGQPMNLLAFVQLRGAIAISSTMATERGVKAGQTLAAYTPQGKVDLAVLAVFDDNSLSSLYGGRVGVMEIHSAQTLFNRGRTVDRIDLVTEQGAAIERVRASLKQRLGGGLDIERPEQRAQEVEDAISIVKRGFLLTSLIAMLISSFLIFNAMSIAVNQRWKEIAVLRSIGVERSNIRNMFLYEAGVIGVIGSGLGIAGGHYLALVSSHITGGITSAVSIGMPSLIADIAVPETPGFKWVVAVESIAIGIIATLLSTWLPARAASHVNPVLALHNIEIRRKETVIGWPRMAIGCVLIGVGLGLIRYTTPVVGVLTQLSYFGFILSGMVLMLPGLSCWIARLLRPVADGAMGSAGALAVDSIILAPRRTSATVGAIMTGLAFVFSNFAFIQSQKAAVVGSFERDINCDLRIWAGSSMTDQLASRIAAVPGIRSVDRLTGVAIRYKRQTVELFASDMALRLGRPGASLQSGDIDRARDLVPRGKGALVSNVFASRWGVSVGDVLGVDSPTAHLELPIAGVIENNGQSWLEGVIYIDRALYEQYWNDPKIWRLDVGLDRAADAGAVRNQIEALAADGQLLFIMTSDEFRSFIKGAVESNIDRLFKFFYAQMVVAGFVAAIGIVNTLVISVWDRRREIGIIRAVGGTRGQVAGMVIVEAIALGVLGLVTAAIKGLFDTYFMSRTAAAVFGGYSVPFHIPVSLMVASIPVVAAVALGAAWWPARIAANTNVVSAIGSE